MKKNLSALTTIALLLLMLPGCASRSSRNPDGSTDTTWRIDKKAISDYAMPISAALGAGLGQAFSHNTEGTLAGAGIGAGVGLIFNWLSDNDTSKNQLHSQSTRPPSEPFLIYDGRSKKSKQLGMDLNGDTKIVGIVTYDQLGNPHTEKFNLKFINGNWVLDK
jgi:hypothetical protein